MKNHYHLKTWCEYYQAIIDGTKTFELRFNDRGFQEGDELVLQEWCPETEDYTGRGITKEIGFMVQGKWGLPEKVCVMSLLDAEE